MFQQLVQFAVSAQEDTGSDLFGSLGIDWTLLLLQILAFLLLMWFLAKFVYPPLTRSMETRERALRESSRAVAEAEKRAEALKEEIAEALKKAKNEASDIVAVAKGQAEEMTQAAEKKSAERSKQIIADAQAEIEHQVEAARKTLRNETLELVADATEKVTRSVVSAKQDKVLIEKSLGEIR